METNKIDSAIIYRDGPFCEFKQDVSIVSMETVSGETHKNILLLYPNEIIGMEGFDKLPFDPRDVIKIYQDEVDLKKRANKSWLFKL